MDTGHGIWNPSLEQLRRELVEVIAPVNPSVRSRTFQELCVEPVLLEHVHRGTRCRDQTIVRAGREPDQFQAFLEFRIVQGGFVLLFKRGEGGVGARAGVGWVLRAGRRP